MVYVGRFTEKDIKDGTQTKAIEKAKAETGLNYVETKLIFKNKKPIAMDIYVCEAKEFTI